MEGFLIIFFLLIILFILALCVGLYVLTSFIFKKILEKDGRNGMLGFVPFYRYYLLTEMSGINWYWFLLLFAPFLGSILSFIPVIGFISSIAFNGLAILASVNIYYNLYKRFRADDGVFIILVIFPIVGLGMLAFSDKYKYDKTLEVKPDGFLGDLGLISKPSQNNYRHQDSQSSNFDSTQDNNEEVNKEEEKKDKKEKKKTNKKES